MKLPNLTNASVLNVEDKHRIPVEILALPLSLGTMEPGRVLITSDHVLHSDFEGAT